LDQREVAVTGMGDTAQADVADIGNEKTLRRAGHQMRELGVAALAVCGEDGQFLGIITRDMVVDSIAAGSDPKTVTVGEVAFMRPSSLAHIR
jgi:CBS domain-containing protein